MKKVYRFISMVLVIAMMVSSIPVIAAPETEQPEVVSTTSGENEATTEVIEINDAKELQLIGTDANYPLNGNYVLVSDINMEANETTGGLGEGTLFKPIGDEANPFTGTFDGMDSKGTCHVISHLNVDTTSYENQNNAGLFGCISGGGTVKNVGIEDGSVKGANNVGGIVGSLSEGTVENCYYLGSVSGTECVGGAVGCSGGQKTDSTSGELSTTVSTIRNCYQIGTIEGVKNVGGLAGQVYSASGKTAKLENCYHTGKIKCTDTSVKVNDSLGNYMYFGGIIGSYYSEGGIGNYYFADCYYNKQSSGNATLAIGSATNGSSEIAGFELDDDDLSNELGKKWSVKGLNTDEMIGPHALDHMTGFVETIYGEYTQFYVAPTLGTYGGVNYYPQLRSFVPSGRENDLAQFPIEDMSGADENPDETPTPDEPVSGVIEINDETELQKIGKDDSYPLYGEYILVSDLNMEGIDFEPIGDSNHPFTGIFNGNSKTISGLHIDGDKIGVSDDLGLFGLVSEGGVVKNLGVENGTVENGRNNVGGIAGWVAEGTIENCYYKGNVSGSECVGGVVGCCGQVGAFSGIATVKNCYQIGRVEGNNNVGGIVGKTSSVYGVYTTVENCYHTGNITCVNNCGGLVGCYYNDGGVGSFSFVNSYYNSEDSSDVTKSIGYVTDGEKEIADFELGDADFSNELGKKSNFKGLTKDQMTGSDALNNMIGMVGKDGKNVYIAPPGEVGVAGYSYYPQLSIFVTDQNNINEFPSVYYEEDDIPEESISISSAEDLQKIGNTEGYSLDRSYHLTNNIDMSGVDFDSIGSETIPFVGTLDGKGYVITGYNGSNGLFKYIGEGGTVKNLGVDGVITGDAQDDNIGGISGSISKGTIENCYFKGSISGGNYVGGVAGYSLSSNILNSYHIGTITTKKYAGGIVGKLVSFNEVKSKVNGCYHSGYINCKSVSKCGGLIGFLDCSFDQAELANCYYDKENSGIACYAIGGDSSGTSKEGYDKEDARFMGLTTQQMTGPDVFNAVAKTIDNAETERAYIAAPQQTDEEGNYYYPQCSILMDNEKTLDEYNSLSEEEQKEYLAQFPSDPSANAIGIYNEDQFIKIGVDDLYPLSANYILFADINMEQINDFEPIGTKKDPFTGKFNGNGHVISHLKIDVGDGQYYAGLFGYIGNGGTVKNLCVNGSVTGGNYVGGVAGYISEGASVENCYFDGEVSGTISVGGVVGCNDFSKVVNCYQIGSILGTKNVGGVVGEVISKYSTETGEGPEYKDDVIATVEGCYHTGCIFCEDVSLCGGLVGCYKGDVGGCSFKNSYYDNEASGDANFNGELGNAIGFAEGSLVHGDYDEWNFKGLSTSEMTGPDSANYMIGLIDGTENSSYIAPSEKFDGLYYYYPQLSLFVQDSTDISEFPKVSVSILGRMIPIYSAVDLKKIGNKNYPTYTLDAEYILMNDINMNLVSDFKPIGYENGRSFTGTFNGNGHEIYNLNINIEDENKVGLFSSIKGGTVKNLGLRGSVTGANDVGGLAGIIYDGAIIENCYFIGGVYGDTSIGGLVGQVGKENEGSAKIINSYHIGTILGNTKVGGITGTFVMYNVDECYPTIQNCYHSGYMQVEDDDLCGGLIGVCYNFANVEAILKSSYYNKDNNGDVKWAIGAYGKNKRVDYDDDRNFKGLSTEQMTGPEALTAMTGMYDDKLQKDAYIAPPQQKDGGEYYYPQLSIFVDDSLEGDEYLAQFPKDHSLNGISIYNASDLKKIGNDTSYDLDYNYILANDIDLKDEKFEPIGDDGDPFTGTFNGNGHTIYGLNVDTGDYAGLFGCVKEGTVKNVKVEGIVTGDTYVGGVVGWLARESTVENCSFIGNVFGEDEVGGIAGRQGDLGAGKSGGNAFIRKCYHVGGIAGTDCVGGISGKVVNASGDGDSGLDPEMGNCYHTGAIQYEDYGGGLIGYFKNVSVAENDGDKTDCNLYNSFYDYKNCGVVKDGKAIGGNYGTKSATDATKGDHPEWKFMGLTTEEMTGPEAFCIKPKDDTQPEDTDKVIPDETSEMTPSDSTSDDSTTEDKDESTSDEPDEAIPSEPTSDDNTTDDKTIDIDSYIAAPEQTGTDKAGNTVYYYPQLSVFINDEKTLEEYSALSEEEQKAYLSQFPSDPVNNKICIYTANQLKAAGNSEVTLGADYILMNDIELNEKEEFKPIGDDSDPFTGSFDGNRHTIYGLNVNTGDYAGLFGCVENGTVKNVKVEGTVTGETYVGGVVGWLARNSYIENCAFIGNIFGEDEVGGIAGRQGDLGTKYGATGGNAFIRNCYHIGGIAGTDCVGGIAGKVVNAYYDGKEGKDPEMGNCYHTGAIQYKDYGGGLIGYFYNSKIIENDNDKTDCNLYTSFYDNQNCGAVGANQAIGGCTGKDSDSSYTDATKGDHPEWNFKGLTTEEMTGSEAFCIKPKDDTQPEDTDKVTSAEPTEVAPSELTSDNNTTDDKTEYIDMEKMGYVAAPEQTGKDEAGNTVYYYPQLSVFINDEKTLEEYSALSEEEQKAYLSQFPSVWITNKIGIYNEFQLKAIGNSGVTLGADYILINDIELNENEEFKPIGSYKHSFTGTFDGNGHTIYGLLVDEGGSDEVGLFGAVDDHGWIANLRVVGTVFGGNNTGGIVGWLGNDTEINNCCFIGNVYGDDATGGVVGLSGDKGSIANDGNARIIACYHVGGIVGSDDVGGVVGKVVNSRYDGYGKPQVIGCYHSGYIHHNGRYHGGLIGYYKNPELSENNYEKSDCEFKNSYYDNQNSNVKKAIGGTYGFGDGSNLYTDAKQGDMEKERFMGLSTEQMTGSMALDSMKGMVDESGKSLYVVAPMQTNQIDGGGASEDITDEAEELKTDEAKKETGTDNESESEETDGSTDDASDDVYYYPQLSVFSDEITLAEYESLSEEEQKAYLSQFPVNTSEKAIPIHNPRELQAIGYSEGTLSANYILMNDIDMTGVEFEPIGTEGEDFNGRFNGNSFVISNLNIDKPDSDYVGLFGCAGSGAIIKDLGVTGNMKGSNYIGGLVGWLSDGGFLSNCFFVGDVSGNSHVGGLVGQTGVDPGKGEAIKWGLTGAIIAFEVILTVLEIVIVATGVGAVLSGVISKFFGNMWETITNFFNQFDSFDDAMNQLKKAIKELPDKTKELRNKIKNKIKALQDKIKDKIQDDTLGKIEKKILGDIELSDIAKDVLDSEDIDVYIQYLRNLGFVDQEIKSIKIKDLMYAIKNNDFSNEKINEFYVKILKKELAKNREMVDEKLDLDEFIEYATKNGYDLNYIKNQINNIMVEKYGAKIVYEAQEKVKQKARSNTIDNVIERNVRQGNSGIYGIINTQQKNMIKVIEHNIEHGNMNLIDDVSKRIKDQTKSIEDKLIYKKAQLEELNKKDGIDEISEKVAEKNLLEQEIQSLERQLQKQKQKQDSFEKHKDALKLEVNRIKSSAIKEVADEIQKLDDNQKRVIKDNVKNDMKNAIKSGEYDKDFIKKYEELVLNKHQDLNNVVKKARETEINRIKNDPVEMQRLNKVGQDAINEKMNLDINDYNTKLEDINRRAEENNNTWTQDLREEKQSLDKEYELVLLKKKYKEDYQQIMQESNMVLDGDENVIENKLNHLNEEYEENLKEAQKKIANDAIMKEVNKKVEVVVKKAVRMHINALIESDDFNKEVNDLIKEAIDLKIYDEIEAMYKDVYQEKFEIELTKKAILKNLETKKTALKKEFDTLKVNLSDEKKQEIEKVIEPIVQDLERQLDIKMREMLIKSKFASNIKRLTSKEYGDFLKDIFKELSERIQDKDINFIGEENINNIIMNQFENIIKGEGYEYAKSNYKTFKGKTIYRKIVKSENPSLLKERVSQVSEDEFVKEAVESGYLDYYDKQFNTKLAEAYRKTYKTIEKKTEEEQGQLNLIASLISVSEDPEIIKFLSELNTIIDSQVLKEYKNLDFMDNLYRKIIERETTQKINDMSDEEFINYVDQNFLYSIPNEKQEEVLEALNSLEHAENSMQKRRLYVIQIMVDQKTKETYIELIKKTISKISEDAREKGINNLDDFYYNILHEVTDEYLKANNLEYENLIEWSKKEKNIDKFLNYVKIKSIDYYNDISFVDKQKNVNILRNLEYERMKKEIPGYGSEKDKQKFDEETKQILANKEKTRKYIIYEILIQPLLDKKLIDEKIAKEIADGKLLVEDVFKILMLKSQGDWLIKVYQKIIQTKKTRYVIDELVEIIKESDTYKKTIKEKITQFVKKKYPDKYQDITKKYDKISKELKDKYEDEKNELMQEYMDILNIEPKNVVQSLIRNNPQIQEKVAEVAQEIIEEKAEEIVKDYVQTTFLTKIKAWFAQLQAQIYLGLTGFNLLAFTIASAIPKYKYMLWMGPSSVRNCYHIGAVSGSDDIGGLVGKVRSSESVTYKMRVENSYHSGAINCKSKGDCGGLVGYYNGRANHVLCLNSYYDYDNGGDAGIYNSIGSNSDYMSGDIDNFKGMSMEQMTGPDALAENAMALNVTTDAKGNSISTEYFTAPSAQTDDEGYYYYPQLTTFVKDSSDVNQFPSAQGCGSTVTFTPISTAEQLMEIDDTPEGMSGNYMLMNDITFTAEDNFEPIYSDSTASNGWKSTGFSGTFIGNGYTIDIGSVKSNDSLVGLFGEISGGHVYDLNVKGNIQGGNYTGLLAGRITNGGVVDSCSIEGNVKNTNSHGCVGGVTGELSDKSHMTYCSHIGVTEGTSHVGGLTGNMTSEEGTPTLKGCYNAGPVYTSDTSTSGALVGKFDGYFEDAVFLNNYYDYENVGDLRYNKAIGNKGDCEGLYGLTTAEMTGPDAFENMPGVASKYTVPPVSSGDGISYYPQLKTSVENSENADEFPSVENVGQTNVIEIDSADELLKIGKDSAYPLNGKYVLTCDIDFGGKTIEPIGSEKNAFTGSFDGVGHTISNVYINTESSSFWTDVGDFFGADNANDYAGFFSKIEDTGCVINTVWENINVTGDQHVGLITGYMENGARLENCQVKGDSKLKADDDVGGLTGELVDESTIKSCSVDCEIEADERVGGTAGYATDSFILDSNHEGLTIGHNDVGGMVGKFKIRNEVTSSLKGCYASGYSGANESKNTGALVGYMRDEGYFQKHDISDTDFRGSYYNNDNYGNSSGGAIGDDSGYDGDTNGGDKKGYNFKGLAVEKMSGERALGIRGMSELSTEFIAAPVQSNKIESEMVKAEVDETGVVETKVAESEIVQTNDEEIYYLPQNQEFISDSSNPDEFIEADGENVIYIYTPEDLQLIASSTDRLGLDYKLMNDLDLTNCDFVPIGTDGESYSAFYDVIDIAGGDFSGSFDGNGHTIKVDVNRSGEDNVGGVFGCVGSGGSVKNLRVEGNVVGEDSVGGIVGWLSDDATIENCCFVGNVNGDENIGGIAGYQGDLGPKGGNSDIKNCYHVGAVFGREDVGGITGEVAIQYHSAHADFDWPEISNCYHTGYISAEKDYGGLIGYVSSDWDSTDNYTFKNSYYDKNNSGIVSKAIGGAEKGNTSTPFSGGNILGMDKDGGDLTKSNFKGLTTEEMTGSNALAKMPGFSDEIEVEVTDEEGNTSTAKKSLYVAPSEQSITDENVNTVHYYPQLRTFVTDESNLKQFPSILAGNKIGISTVEELKFIESNELTLGASYVLMNDIDLTGVDFDPIGTSGDDFNGTFDGNGHVITGLNTNGGKYQGLFGCVGSGGTVKNLGVKGYVTGTDYVGGLVAWLSDGATVENCYFMGDVTGDENIGGLVGYSGDKGVYGGNSDIISCYHVGKVKGTENVGGIAGKVVNGFNDDHGEPTVENCYHTGCIEGEKDYGGLVGYFENTEIMGDNGGYGSDCDFINSYYNKEISCVTSAVGGTRGKTYSSIEAGDQPKTNFIGLTTDQMTGPNAFNSMTGFNSEFIVIDENGKISMGNLYTASPKQTDESGEYYYYPQLSIFVTDANDHTQFPSLNNIKGIPIYTEDELRKIGHDSAYPLSSAYTLMNDITMSDNKFTPIGTEGNPFTGKFYGEGHVISNLKVDVGDNSDYAGLFAHIQNGIVKDLGVDGFVKGADYVGGLVAWLGKGATVENCYFTGEVKGYDKDEGIFDDGDSENVGGLAGYSGDKGLGGGSSDIINCYTICKVTGTEDVGGIVGQVVDNGKPKVKDCYHAGSITCDGNDNCGGIIGYYGGSFKSDYFDNCYYDNQNSGDANTNKKGKDNAIGMDSSCITTKGNPKDYDNSRFRGQTTVEMTGANAISCMNNIGVKEENGIKTYAYGSHFDINTYPQLMIFIDDRGDLSEYPTIDMAG